MSARCGICRGNAYADGAFDFLAVYVIPVEVWYIIPAEKIAGQGSVAVYPRLKTAKYEGHREAWELLEGTVERIEACEDSGPWAVVGGQLLMSAMA